MRVLLLHNTFSKFGGAEIHVEKLYQDLRNRLIDVELVSLDSAGGTKNRRTKSLLSRLLFHITNLVAPADKAILQSVRRANPDVVHLHNWMGISLRTFLRFQNIPIKLHTVHDFGAVDPHTTVSRNYPLLIKAALKLRASVVMWVLRDWLWLFPSQRTFENFRSFHGISPRRAVILPLGYYDDLNLQNLPLGRKRVVGFIGALSAHKGVTDVLKAAEILQNKDIHFVIAGDGPLRDEVVQCALQLPNVEYSGSVADDDKRAFFESVSVTLMPSRWAENYSQSCCESLLATRPIVSSAIASPPMAKGKSVLHFETGNGYSLSQKIEEMFHSIENDSETVAKDCTISAHEFDPEVYFSKLMKLYQGVDENVVKTK